MKAKISLTKNYYMYYIIIINYIILMVSLRTPSVDILSFSDLESLESPSWDQLIETLSDYVQSGAAISGRVVIEILKKCKFQDPEHSLVHPLTTIMNLATS